MFDEKVYIETLNNALTNEQFFTIDSVFGEYNSLGENEAIKLLKVSFKSNLILNSNIKKAHNFINYWNLLDNYFEHFDDSEKNLIIEQIEKVDSWNNLVEKSIFNILHKFSITLDSESKINLYKKYLKKFITRGFTIPFLDLDYIDNDLNCLWLIFQLNKSSLYSNIDRINTNFDFSQYTFPMLFESLTKISDDKKYDSISSLIVESQLSLFIKLLSENKLFYKGKEIFPIKFYKIQLIQKIYIYLTVKKNYIILPSILNKVGETLDLSYRFYGNDFNIFLKIFETNLRKSNPKYDQFVENNYRDLYSETKLYDYYEEPFVCIQVFESKEDAINILKSLKSNLKDIRTSINSEKSIRAQNKELISKLSNVDNWNMNAAIYEYFLIELISNKELKKLYKQTIIDLIIFGLSNKLINDEIPNLYLNYNLYRSKLNSFDYFLEKLFDELIKSYGNIGDSSKFFYKFFFNNINVSKLSSISNMNVNKKSKHIDFLDFINSDLGRYYQVLKSINVEILRKNYTQIISNLNKICEYYKSYLIGFLFEILKIEDVPKIANTNIFIGYSHSYNLGQDSSKCDYFKDVCIHLLNSDLNDEYVAHNIAIVLINTVDPKDLISNSSRLNDDFKARVLQEIARFYLISGDESLGFSLSWITYFYLSFEFSVEIISNEVLLHILESRSLNIEKLIRKLKEYKPKHGFKKINEYELLHIRNLQNFTQENHIILYYFIEYLLEKKLLIISQFFINGIENVFEDLISKKLISIMSDYLALLSNYFLSNSLSELRKMIPKT